jgi:4-hydroxy-tetrahydrodipicolinate synthase
LSTGALGLALPGGGMVVAQRSGSKPLRGIFPIAQTPFTEADKLDLDALVEEVKFIDRGRVPGFVWPQLASEWSTLTEPERLAGAEAIAAVGKRLRPALVLGVQGPNVAAAVNYAKHAEKVGADAIISLPPANQSDPKAVLAYYQEVGKATELPLFVQAVGTMSVDLLVELYQAVPTLRYVKDEAGQPLMRIGPLRQKTSDQLKVFTGAHGRTLIDEMQRGFAGSMPAAAFADLYAAAWELWHEGKKKEAMDVFAKAALFITEIGAYGLEALKYLLCLRGVFTTYRTRERPASGGSGGRAARLDETGKQVLRDMLDYVKPYLRA